VFLGYRNLHKGFKCLDITSGRVYISGDVVFDEGVYPFRKLNPNVGTRLRAKILLLPSQSQPPSLSGHGDENLDFPAPCVHVNLVSTIGACSLEVAAENLVQNDADMQEISSVQEAMSGSRAGTAPDADSI
jgi:hypothetical protein